MKRLTALGGRPLFGLEGGEDAHVTNQECFARLSHRAPKPKEAVDIKAYFPASAIAKSRRCFRRRA